MGYPWLTVINIELSGMKISFNN